MTAMSERYIYKTVGGCQIGADVYRPPAATPGPTVLWLHGGGLIFGDRSALPPYQLSRYLQAGLTVAAVDYRLAPETKLPGIVEDLCDAYRWLLQEGPPGPGIDPSRVAVIGHSAGGYLALLAGHWLRPRPRALVAFYGYGDITGTWYSRPDLGYCRDALVAEETAWRLIGREAIAADPSERRFPFYLHCRQRGLWPQHVAGHDPEAEAAWYVPYCPERNVGPDYPPTVLIHGTEDADVPIAQSKHMADELTRNGVPHRLLALPGRGHVFDLAAGAQSDPVVTGVMDEVLAFLARHTA